MSGQLYNCSSRYNPFSLGNEITWIIKKNLATQNYLKYMLYMSIFFSNSEETKQTKKNKVNYHVLFEPHNLLWWLYRQRLDMSHMRPSLWILGYRILPIEEVKKEEEIER